MRKFALFPLSAVVALILTAAAPAGHVGGLGHPDDERFHALQHLQGTGVPPGGEARNFRVIGHHDLGGGGLNADVYSHGNFAYVGVWSGPCPATGVKVVDISNPARPVLAARLQNDPGTSAEDVVVMTVSTPFFRGNLAGDGHQACQRIAPVFRGSSSST